VSVGVCLLVYSLAVLVLGPPSLQSLTYRGLAPRLGVSAWLTAIGSVLFAWLLALSLSIAQAVRFWDHRGVIVALCMARLHQVVVGGAGIAAQIVLLAIVVSASVAAVVAGVRLVKTVTRMRDRAHEHAGVARLVGRRTGARDVVVVEAAQPAAYAVSGRPPAIVVTSAAVRALDEQQLAAVLAHERAHLAGRHWLLVSVLRGLAAVFPRLTLMTQGEQQVSLLLEMCADDSAARHHEPRALLSGLITLCRTGPAEALAAADVAVLARAERLARPRADPHEAPTRVALIAAIAIAAAGPSAITVLAACGALMCGS
jgi:beta-lactamase regulating signal transducer with metallopeptidase domain